MESPLTAAFVRSLQPLPPSDRRALLKEMAVVDVRSRDEDGFYEWLAAQYRAGALPTVDAALRRCCAKADERTGTHRVVSWLVQQAGDKGQVPADDGGDRLAELVARARASSPAAAALIEALAPNFPWFSALPEAEPGRPASGRSAMVDAAALAERLARALSALADEPDLDLLLRADGLAGAIEDHLARAGDRAERQNWTARAEAALAGISSTDPDHRVDLSGLGVAALREVAEAAEAVQAALAADASAREALRGAVDAPRADRRIAEAARDDAEDALAAAQDRLRAAIPAIEESEEGGTGDPTDAPPAEQPGPIVPADAPGESRWEPVDDVGSAPVSDEGPAAAPVLGDADAADAAAPAVASTFDRPPPLVAPLPEPDPADAPQADAAATDGTGPWAAWIATALAADRVGLAFHLATARDLAGGAGADDIPAAVLEALVRGRATRAAYDGDWRRYEDGRERLMALAGGEDPTAAGQAVVLLIAAGALRPALLQSQAALDVLSALSGDIAARLNPLVRMLADMRHVNLQSLQEIAAPAGEEARQARIAATCAALEQWQRNAPRRGPGFQRGAVVWQNLTGSLGRIGSVVDAVLAGAPDAGTAARALVTRLSDRAQAEQMVLDADDSRSGRNNPVQGPAMRHLINLCGDVGEKLQDWLLAQGLPTAGNDRLGARRKQLLAALRVARDVAIAAATTRGPLTNAAGVFAAVIDQLQLSMEGGGDRAWTPDDELALLAAFPLNARIDVRIDADDALDLERAAAGALGAGVPSADDAFGAAAVAADLLDQRAQLQHLGRAAAGAGDPDLCLDPVKVRQALRGPDHPLRPCGGRPRRVTTGC